MKGRIMPLVICSALLMACQKQPVASFTTDKSSYTAGETITITNTTTDGSGNYAWGFASALINSASTDVSPTINIPENHPDGELAIALKATSSNGKKSSNASLSVNINAAKGSVIFWQMTGSGYGTTTVTINSVSNVITGEVGSIPNCLANGCATFYNMPIGNYNYTATDGTSNWSGSFTVQKDGCTKKQLL